MSHYKIKDIDRSTAARSTVALRHVFSIVKRCDVVAVVVRDSVRAREEEAALYDKRADDFLAAGERLVQDSDPNDEDVAYRALGFLVKGWRARARAIEIREKLGSVSSAQEAEWLRCSQLAAMFEDQLSDYEEEMQR